MGSNVSPWNSLRHLVSAGSAQLHQLGNQLTPGVSTCWELPQFLCRWTLRTDFSSDLALNIFKFIYSCYIGKNQHIQGSIRQLPPSMLWWMAWGALACGISFEGVQVFVHVLTHKHGGGWWGGVPWALCWDKVILKPQDFIVKLVERHIFKGGTSMEQ